MIRVGKYTILYIYVYSIIKKDDCIVSINKLILEINLFGINKDFTKFNYHNLININN